MFVPAIAYRFAQGGDTLRLDFWRSALTIFIQPPLFGAGPGTWVQLKVAASPPGVPNVLVPTAHDMYVQAAAELGIVGLVALAILAVATVRRGLQVWRDGAPAAHAHAGAVLVGLVAFAGQLVVDNLVNLPFTCVLVIGLVAWGRRWVRGSGATDRRRGPRPGAESLDPRRGRPARGTRWTPPRDPHVHPNRPGVALRPRRWQRGTQRRLATALAAFEQARQLDPDFTLYDIQTAGAFARVGRTGEAKSLLTSAVTTDQVAVVQISLAALEAAMGDLTSAMKHARTAAALGLGEPTVELNAGIVGEQAGDPAFALDQFANAIAWDPPLARSTFWDAPARAVAKADIVAAARQRANTLDAALILAWAGDPSGARVEVQGVPASELQDAYLAAIEWIGGDVPSARARLVEATGRDPLDLVRRGLDVPDFRLSGDLAIADRYARWATLVQADTAPSTIAEMSVLPAVQDAAEAGVPGNYPWSTNLRPQSASLLVPQLILIGAR